MAQVKEFLWFDLISVQRCPQLVPQWGFDVIFSSNQLSQELKS